MATNDENDNARWAYDGNGSTSTFAYDNKIFTDSDLLVYVDGVLQTLTTDYSVTNAGTADGGNVVFVTPPADETEIVIVRNVQATQQSDYVDGDQFPADVVEDDFDRAIICIQQLIAKIARTIRLADSDATESFTALPDATERASKILGFDASGAPEMQTPNSETYITLTAFAETLIAAVSASAARTVLGAQADLDVVGQAEAEAGTATTERIWTSQRVAQAIAALAPLMSENLLVNGGFQIAQLGTAFTAASSPANNDDTYLLDQWINLSDGNDIVDVSQETTTVPDGEYAAIKLDIETANKKAGILQVIEAKDAARVIGGTATLTFQARAGGSNVTIDKLRAAVISWSSTADSVTSDIVSAWNAEGADPTLVANWSYENTPSDLTLTDSYQTFTIESVSIDTASAANVGVFIWIDNDDGTIGDLVYIADVALVEGAAATVQKRPYVEELTLCQRYLLKTFADGTAPAQSAGFNGSFSNVANSSGNFGTRWQFPVNMRVAPSITTYNPSAANTSWRNGNDGTDTACTVTQITESSAYLKPTSVSGSDASDNMFVHAMCDARL